MNDISMNIFENIKLGKFKIIINKDKSVLPKLYLDEVLKSLFDAKNINSAEKLYEYWKSNVKQDYIKYIDNVFEQKYLDELIEIEYPWKSSENKWLYIRLNGQALNNDCCIEINGYQQDITSLYTSSDIDEKLYNIRDPYKYKKYCSFYSDVYDEIYEIDLEKHYLQTIFFRKNVNKTVEENGDIFKIIESHVYPEDRHILSDILKPENIDKMRLEKNAKHIEFRSKKQSGGYEWIKMNCILVNLNGKENILLYGYSIEQEKQSEAIKKEKEAIVSAIVADHTAVLDVDLNTEQINPLKYTVGDYTSSCNLEQMVYNLVEFYAQKVDENKIKQFLSIENLKKIAFSHTKTFCDIQLKNEVFGYGWLRISAIGSKKLKNRVFLMIKNMSGDYMLEILMNEYVSKNCEDLYYINCNTNGFIEFSGKNQNGDNISRQGKDYIAEIQRYVDRFVVEEDQNLVRQKMLPIYVLECLENTGLCNLSYGILDNNGDYKRKFVQFQYYDKENNIILLMRSDITASYMLSIEEQRKMRKDAITDYLTGIYNRFGLEKEINENLKVLNEIEDNISAFILLDLDNFKNVNDLLGHITGDKALKRVANILKQSFRNSDLVARLGGDEFVIFMKNIKNQDTIPNFMKRLLKNLNIKFTDGVNTVEIAASIGVALFPRDGKTFDELYKNADKALYSVKNNAKNGCTIYGQNIIYNYH